MNKIYTIKIADAHLSVVIAALSERPFKVAQPIIASLGAQIAAQRASMIDPNRVEVGPELDVTFKDSPQANEPGSTSADAGAGPVRVA